MNIARISQRRRWKKHDERLDQEYGEARAMILNLLASDSPTFIWSYETFMYLGGSYLKRLTRFLETPFPDGMPIELRDANLAYLRSDRGFWNHILHPRGA